ncbi:MAG: hypothetical protein KME32_20100 [Mojavia pulchra JT2-VF2]|uniref:Uncharacterized protein n=1 Tax=Mojavia pulchra JT2-VF2 TaxID=287848 RepID=A0A951UHR8_9NOST|nr:hypothetical protein [Mojavia pulchra JT2-VF2]
MPHEHEEEQGYFGKDVANKDGTTYVELMLKRVNQLPFWSVEDRAGAELRC